MELVPARLCHSTGHARHPTIRRPRGSRRAAKSCSNRSGADVWIGTTRAGAIATASACRSYDARMTGRMELNERHTALLSRRADASSRRLIEVAGPQRPDGGRSVQAVGADELGKARSLDEHDEIVAFSRISSGKIRRRRECIDARELARAFHQYPLAIGDVHAKRRETWLRDRASTRRPRDVAA